MKKVLIAEDLNTSLQQGDSFLKRSDIRVFTAATNDEILKIHRAEHVDLIITHAELPGTNIEKLFATIRGELALGSVQFIMVCANNRNAIELCSRCRPAAVILRPINATILLSRAQKLLDVSARENSRVLINTAVEGSASGSSFFCTSRDISVNGIMIETDKVLQPGSKVTCSFSLSDSKHIKVSGEIVRIADQNAAPGRHLYGVKFLDLSSEQKRMLQSSIGGKPAAEDKGESFGS